MADRILVFYGSYRSDRMGIRLANFIVAGLKARGADAELVDAMAVGLPMLDRMYKEYAPGSAPPALEAPAANIRGADAFVFVTGEYNWGVQPGLKNLTDHFLEEFFWRSAAIASYSAGRLAGARSNFLWHGTLSEMGMIVISSTLTVGPSPRPSAPTASHSGRPDRCSSAPLPASRTISPGGRRRPSCNAPARRLHTEIVGAQVERCIVSRETMRRQRVLPAPFTPPSGSRALPCSRREAGAGRRSWGAYSPPHCWRRQPEPR